MPWPISAAPSAARGSSKTAARASGRELVSTAEARDGSSAPRYERASCAADRRSRGQWRAGVRDTRLSRDDARDVGSRDDAGSHRREAARAGAGRADGARATVRRPSARARSPRYRRTVRRGREHRGIERAAERAAPAPRSIRAAVGASADGAAASALAGGRRMTGVGRINTDRALRIATSKERYSASTCGRNISTDERPQGDRPVRAGGGRVRRNGWCSAPGRSRSIRRRARWSAPATCACSPSACSKTWARCWRRRARRSRRS